MPAPLTSLLDNPLFEPALLRVASRRAHALTDAARARMRPWAHAARARYRVALELRGPEAQGVALGLLREAAFFVLTALAANAADGAALPSSAKAAWEGAGELLQASDAPACLARARVLLAADESLAFEALAARDVPALREAAEQSVAWLLARAEVRSPAELARARWLRVGLSSVALIAIGWALLSYWLALSALS